MPRLQKRSAPTVAIWSFRAQFKESCTDRLAQEFRKVFDVFFRRVERAHPAHNRLLFIPDIKEVTLLKFTDGVLRDLGEDSVSFHFVNHLHLRNLADFLLQQFRHAVRVLGIMQPDVIGEQGFELHSQKTHFGSELHALLADVEKTFAQSFIKKKDRLGAHEAVLRAAEGKHINAQVASGLAQGLAEACSGVRYPCAVHVQKHITFVRESGECLDLFRLVHGTHFGGLGNRNDMRLYVVLVADTVVCALNRFHCQLAVSRGNRNELAAGEFFGRAALVHIDVGGLSADHRVIGLSERLQAEHVGGRAVENEEYIDVRTEVLSEFADRGFRVWVVSISDDMALVDSTNSFEDIVVNAGVVVTGKAAGGFHGLNNLADEVRLRPRRQARRTPSLNRIGLAARAAYSRTKGLGFYYSSGTYVILSRATDRVKVRLSGAVMMIAVLMVSAAFGLLYMVVGAEERHLQEVAKPRRRQ